MYIGTMGLSRTSLSFVFLVSLLTFTGRFVQVQTFDASSATTLFTSLTSSYNILVRPSESFTINVEFSALSILALDVKSQTLTVSGWFTMTWNDTRLAWTPASNGNITTMYFKDTNIWTPEMVIQNAADGVPIIENDDLNIVVDYSGSVKWEPAGVYSVHCDVDITYYPFDTQTCEIEVSTWSYDSTVMELGQTASGVNLDDYHENAEWTMVSSSVGEGSETNSIDASIERDKLLFSFTLQRKTSYYILNVVIPPIVTAFLGLLVFLLPSESGEKTGFSITVLLAMAVLLTIISTYIPTTSVNTSLFAIYLVLVLFVNAAEVLLTIMVLRLHHKDDQNIPVSDSVQRFANNVLARTSRFRPLPCVKSSAKKDRVSPECRISPANSLVQLNNDEKNHIGEFKGKVNRGSATVKMGFVDSKEKTSQESLKEYSWSEIAIMVDYTALYGLTAIMSLLTLVFCVVLATCG